MVDGEEEEKGREGCANYCESVRDFTVVNNKHDNANAAAGRVRNNYNIIMIIIIVIILLRQLLLLLLLHDTAGFHVVFCAILLCRITVLARPLHSVPWKHANSTHVDRG